MKFISTRHKAPVLNFSEALFAGLASDGGLYVPEKFPQFELTSISKEATLLEIAEKIMGSFADELPLKDKIPGICKRSFNFPIRLESIDDSTSVLELYHGPTAAFKDVGARFLAECVSEIDPSKNRTVIVATSGDTGGAVAAAFHGRPHIEVLILFPKGMVSEFQERQLTCWGGNVHAFKVRGTFDDCQRIVKEALLSPDWKGKNLISANSINIGRILPQTVYYAWAALNSFKKNKRASGFIIPSGNLGNSLAALWAKKMGFPIGKIVLAFNANKSVIDYFRTGHWNPAPTVSTLANAMDVGNPSNMERVRYLYPNLEDLKKDVEVFSVSDEEIKTSIKTSKSNWNKALCPHTATAAFARKQLQIGDWIMVATAHAAKFASVVEPLISSKIKFPPSLERFEECEGHSTEIGPLLTGLSK